MGLQGRINNFWIHGKMDTNHCEPYILLKEGVMEIYNQGTELQLCLIYFSKLLDIIICVCVCVYISTASLPPSEGNKYKLYA